MKIRTGFLIGLMAVAMTFPARGEAQSTLEYATLISETSAAAAGAAGNKKNQKQDDGQNSEPDQQGVIGGAVTSLYGQSSDVIGQKGAGLLGQLGQPRRVSAAAPPVEAPAPPPQTQTPAGSGQAAGEQKNVSVLLRSGLTIHGTLVEQNKDYIKVDSAGVVVTYFTDEIEKVE